MNVLIVDDKAAARAILSDILSRGDQLQVHEAAHLQEARRILASAPIDIALIDLCLSDDRRNTDGLTLVREMREKTTAIPVIVSMSSDMESIRAAMRTGAYDYILKDSLSDELVLPIIHGIQSHQRLAREVQQLRARLGPGHFPSGLVGTSEVMAKLRDTIRRVAIWDKPVLVIGPTGSGKELVVEAIHALGPHPTEPLLPVNCGAIPPTLIESELFGHERGAFTGAERKRDGCFTAVQQGTLFLDELAELPLQQQAQLLRVLASGRFKRVGSDAEQEFHGRVVAATHANLEQLARDGRFREDLFHRLDVLTVRVPPLDERKEDIPALVAHFCRQEQRQQPQSRKQRSLRFTEDAVQLLMRRNWPGNVRQLGNFIERLSVFCDADPIDSEALTLFLEEREGGAPARVDGLRDAARSILRMALPNKLEAIDTALITEAMALAEGNKSAAARLLGVHRKAVERRLGRGDDGEE
ncbi:sigma-54 dependent transcriptional regulator [Archangium violaceum]|uniref:sigma-54-dependent transcriptional regulator n=1 Tax=Archangium violaceum TaxID=83451 RepID=UPI002B30E39C|nr:sigma-54 dependent transcriptional regulator [Archangium gephyra]